MNLWLGGEHRIFINKRDRPVRSHFNLGGFDDGLCPIFDHSLTIGLVIIATGKWVMMS